MRNPLFAVFSREFTGRDLILIGGGLFLLAKSTREIHHSLMGDEGHIKAKAATRMVAVLVQIAVLDIVFSLDSVITAIGLANHVTIMIVAIVIAVGVMMLSAKAIGEFVDGHPTIKMLALSFLLLVGFTLFGEGFGLVIPKGYIYFAMGFSVASRSSTSGSGSGWRSPSTCTPTGPSRRVKPAFYGHDKVDMVPLFSISGVALVGELQQRRVARRRQRRQSREHDPQHRVRPQLRP